MDTAVWINIDETPIPYHYGNRHGWKMKKPSDTMKQSMVERVSLQLQRSHCTILASIASRADVQNVLPQILLPKIQGRKKWKAVSTLETRPENVEIIMDTNGWMDMKILKQCLQKLETAMAPVGVNKVVLVMDCHPSHYAWKTLALLKRWKWRVLLIPSKLTGLLQPLDVAIFAGLKKNLHVANMKSNISRHQTAYDFDLWAQNTLTTIGSTFKTLDAKSCFEKCGLTPRRDRIRESVLTYVKFDSLGCIRIISKDELTFYIGKNGDHLHKLLFPDAVPVEMQHAQVHNCVPHQRMSMKRRLHHECHATSSRVT